MHLGGELGLAPHQAVGLPGVLGEVVQLPGVLEAVPDVVVGRRPHRHLLQRVLALDGLLRQEELVEDVAPVEGRQFARQQRHQTGPLKREISPQPQQIDEGGQHIHQAHGGIANIPGLEIGPAPQHGDVEGGRVQVIAVGELRVALVEGRPVVRGDHQDVPRLAVEALDLLEEGRRLLVPEQHGGVELVLALRPEAAGPGRLPVGEVYIVIVDPQEQRPVPVLLELVQG